MAQMSWAEGNALMAELGGEEWLAARIETERKARGWSQAQLAKELAAIDRPIHQSAISKIEAPPKKDGRRSISIDEAIAFARVFGIPVGELLLPPATVAIASFLKNLGEGPAKLRQTITAESSYRSFVRDLARQIASDSEARQTWLNVWAVEKKRAAERGADPSDSITLMFHADLLDEVTQLQEGDADE